MPGWATEAAVEKVIDQELGLKWKGKIEQ